LARDSRQITSMIVSRHAARRALLFGVLCFFAFARVALGSDSCAAGVPGCPPAGMAGHAHSAGHGSGEACANQTAASQHAGSTASADAAPHAIPPALGLALSIRAPFETPRLPSVGSLSDATLLLVTSGRLRL
jgi:hypothetical protein